MVLSLYMQYFCAVSILMVFKLLKFLLNDVKLLTMRHRINFKYTVSTHSHGQAGLFHNSRRSRNT